MLPFFGENVYRQMTETFAVEDVPVQPESGGVRKRLYAARYETQPRDGIK